MDYVITHSDYVLPQRNDRIKTWFSGCEDGYSTVLEDPQLYTGLYRESFTHVLKVSALKTKRGWMEVLFKLETR